MLSASRSSPEISFIDKSGKKRAIFMSFIPFESYFQEKDNYATLDKIQLIYCPQDGQSAKTGIFGTGG